ncbi:MAG: aminoglycoside phosphotransferase family protein [Cyclobacteriaceae bacterium]
MEVNIEKVLESFSVSGIKSVATFDSGLINKSYHILTHSKEEYVLQKINSAVFGDAEKMMLNILLAHDQLKNEGDYFVPEILFTRTGKPLMKDEVGNDWRLMRFISGSTTYDSTSDPKIAMEAGRIIGRFHHGTLNCSLNQMHITLPDFHDMDFRTEWFLKGLGSASAQRLGEASGCIEQVERLLDEGIGEVNSELPLRVTHNDTKLNNVLFDETSGKALCLIDLDTVMPGYLFHDFGDALRTLCNTTEEDDKNFESVSFNFELFESFLKGYISVMGKTLTPVEWEALPVSVTYMPFIMAVRFLTDYLFEDRYYQTEYPEHNLIRCMNQLKLLDEIRVVKDDIKRAIDIVRRDFS